MRVRGAAGLDQASFENVDRSRGAAVIVEIDVASAGPPEEPRIEPILGAEGLVPSLARTRRDEAAERACLGDCASPSQATNGGQELGRTELGVGDRGILYFVHQISGL